MRNDEPMTIAICFNACVAQRQQYANQRLHLSYIHLYFVFCYLLIQNFQQFTAFLYQMTNQR